MRRSLLAAAAVLLLSLAVACRAPVSTGMHIDSALADLIPADTVFLAGLKLDALRATPVYQKHFSQLTLPQLNELTARTGLDARKDFSEVLSCSNGKSAVLLVRGSFRPAELQQKLLAQGAKRFDYLSTALYGDERAAFGVLGSSIALAGPTPMVRSALDARHGKSQGVPPALESVLKSIPPDRQIWAALSGGFPAAIANVPPGSNAATVLRLLQGLQTATLGITFARGLDLNAHSTCQTDRDAKRIHDAIKGVVGFGRLSTPDNRPELLKVYDAIEVRQNGAEVEVSASVAPDLVDLFLDLWLQSGRGIVR